MSAYFHDLVNALMISPVIFIVRSPKIALNNYLTRYLMPSFYYYLLELWNNNILLLILDILFFNMTNIVSIFFIYQENPSITKENMLNIEIPSALKKQLLDDSEYVTHLGKDYNCCPFTWSIFSRFLYCSLYEAILQPFLACKNLITMYHFSHVWNI